MQESRSFHVLIIGGGIGGLCLAQGLKQSGISVAVYERDQSALPDREADEKWLLKRRRRL